ncbi:TetR/AcrR family transcriptional regulator [Nocardia sp. NPDC051833]|uniref:TetR/AcrR family transcriptional regulator n=1 Tax=Nocardia sp. NPDC051833 TaxID=3155674 RepID=UPI003425436F
MTGNQGKTSKKPPASSGTTTTPAPRRTQQERTAQAEQALLDAAAALFARRGVDRTSLADVGLEAGYSRGLVNHHFGSKAALIDRLAHDIQARFVAGIVTKMTESGDDAVETLVGLVQDYLSALVSEPDAGRAFFVMWSSAIPDEATLRSIFAADDALFRLGVETVVRAGQAEATVDSALDPAATAVTLVGMLRGVGAQYLIAPDAVALTAAIEAGQRFVRHSLSPTTQRKPSRAK